MDHLTSGSMVPESVPISQEPVSWKASRRGCPMQEGAFWKPAPQLQQELGPRRQLPATFLCPHLHSRAGPSSREGVNV